METKTIFYVTDGNYNYYQTYSEKEAYKRIEELVKSDKEVHDMWMKKLGYIPKDVDIPAGYYVTTNRFN